MSAPIENLRSYKHASRIFVDSNYRLSPKYGFLFYVEFDFNPLISNVSNTSAQEMGMIVKSASLPKFTIDTKVHNAYNRKNIVQNRIQYDPIQIVFHDDQSDNVRQFWYDYYSFYYRDTDYADATYQIINKYQERASFDWGYSPRPVGSYNSSNSYQDYQYIQAIRIYSLYQGQFDEYELVNPTITAFRHGEHVNGENNSLLEHQMSVVYETVKYQTGTTTQNNAGGFIDLHYDLTPSSNPYPASTAPSYTTASSDVIDLANYNTKTSGGTVVPQDNTGALAAAFSFGSAAGAATALSTASTTTSGGGFAFPNLGSLTSGINNSAILGQQLQAATVSLAGTAASTLAGGVVGGVTQALGPQGTQIVGMAASAIANPTGALATVENMAIKWASGAVNTAVNQVAGQVGKQVQQYVSTAAGDLNKYLAFNGADTFTGGLANLPNQIVADYNSLTNNADLSTVGFDPSITNSLPIPDVGFSI